MRGGGAARGTACAVAPAGVPASLACAPPTLPRLRHPTPHPLLSQPPQRRAPRSERARWSCRCTQGARGRSWHCCPRSRPRSGSAGPRRWALLGGGGRRGGRASRRWGSPPLAALPTTARQSAGCGGGGGAGVAGAQRARRARHQRPSAAGPRLPRTYARTGRAGETASRAERRPGASHTCMQIEPVPDVGPGPEDARRQSAAPDSASTGGAGAHRRDSPKQQSSCLLNVARYSSPSSSYLFTFLFSCGVRVRAGPQRAVRESGLAGRERLAGRI